MEIRLTPEHESMIREKVASGQYLTVGEVVREALWLLEERDRAERAKFEDLREAIRIGLEQADRGESVDGEAVFARLLSKYGGSEGTSTHGDSSIHARGQA